MHVFALCKLAYDKSDSYEHDLVKKRNGKAPMMTFIFITTHVAKGMDTTQLLRLHFFFFFFFFFFLKIAVTRWYVPLLKFPPQCRVIERSGV